ncbi:MAG: hypothetical protein O2814_03380 [Bacteroidetes bacterium]|nr:hypothetical protein [Bacteroidota bacterium]MDA1224004.1 hypothetical protein [Bacteroidota bacterium]
MKTKQLKWGFFGLMFTGGSAPVRLNLTQEEKDALVAFLRTLTDVSFITDKKFSDPFAN